MPSFAILNFAMKRFVIRDKFGNHGTRILNLTTRKISAATIIKKIAAKIAIMRVWFIIVLSFHQAF